MSDAPSWSDVLALVEQLDRSGLADAEVVTAGVSVRVSRHALPDAAAPPAPSPAPPAVSPAVNPEPVAPQPVQEHATPGGPVVTAPMIGTLYLRPSPDSPPFVAVGDAVTPDTTVAILEVMKLMNPVPAGVHGIVAEVVVPDGSPVEHGDVLFRLEAGR